MSFFNGDIKSSELTLSSSTASNPVLTIENTTNDTNGAIIKFIKDKGAAGAANDVAGLIQFYADDAAQDQVLFSEIKSQVKVDTNGQEGGRFTILVAEHDGTSTAGLVIEDGDADGEVDVTIGAGASSVTTISGDLKVTTDIILDDGGSLKEAGGTAAITFDGSGHVTKIGQDSPLSGQFLKWDGSKAVWDAASGGGGGATVTVQSGNPSMSTSGTEGDFIVDTLSERLYVLVNIIGGSSYNWGYVNLSF